MKKQASGTYVPREEVEQECLMRWVAFARSTRPELDLLYHVPNEGKRSQATGGKLKRMGLRPGVPDLCLPVARGNYNGLYIELKRMDGRATKDQEDWIRRLREQGYAAAVCRGWEKAMRMIVDYLSLSEGGR